MSDTARGLTETVGSRARSGVSQGPRALIGETIDRRYRVDALLGEGGMGLVYRATHTRLHKTLAVKVLRRENTRDPEALARFQREAESASAIGHQHIVDVSDFGVLPDGSTYFVMECLEGMDLIQAMDIAQRMPEERALHIATQICEALGAAHDAGIVHRDLKPENVFLTSRGESRDFVKVLDFGIAKVADGPDRLTQRGEVLGTPHYMSPEQCEGEDVDHRTDIYALGVLLYEMLTGHVPHDADTMMGILTKHMYEDPIPPKIRAPQVSAPLEEVILRCLDKKAERRYQTMRELQADLERIRGGQRPSGPETVTLTPTRPPRPPRRRVAPLVLGALALTLIVAGGALIWDRAGDESTASAPVEPTEPTPVSTQDPPPAEPPPREPTNVAEHEPPTRPATRPTRRRGTKPQPSRSDGPPVILDPWK